LTRVLSVDSLCAMGRPRRADDGGLIYHVLNRANARMTIFEKDGDYEAFERVLIRDALNRHFGGEKTARNQLGLTHKGWSDLGRIANKEPIEESRHRGCHPALRPATENEQSRVLAVTRSMIRAYLDHLDCSSTTV
jgi:hypothetical protein